MIKPKQPLELGSEEHIQIDQVKYVHRDNHIQKFSKEKFSIESISNNISNSNKKFQHKDSRNKKEIHHQNKTQRISNHQNINKNVSIYKNDTHKINQVSQTHRIDNTTTTSQTINMNRQKNTHIVNSNKNTTRVIQHTTNSQHKNNSHKLDNFRNVRNSNQKINQEQVNHRRGNEVYKKEVVRSVSPIRQTNIVIDVSENTQKQVRSQ